MLKSIRSKALGKIRIYLGDPDSWELEEKDFTLVLSIPDSKKRDKVLKAIYKDSSMMLKKQDESSIEFYPENRLRYLEWAVNFGFTGNSKTPKWMKHYLK